MENQPSPQLRPATRDEIESALKHALRFDGKRAFKLSSEMVAAITAAYLAECLEASLMVVMVTRPVEQ